MDGSKFPLRGYRFCEIGWRWTFHRPTMAFGMRWHGTRQSVAWRGMPCHTILTVPIHRLDDGSQIQIQDSIRDRPKQTPLNGLSFPTSPHLISSCLGSIPGFPWGFPIASPPLPPISGNSHKQSSPSLFPRLSFPPTRPPWTTFCL